MTISDLLCRARGFLRALRRDAPCHRRASSHFCIVGFAFGLLLHSLPAHAGEGTFEPLSIVTATGPHQFSVEVMRTQPELEKGLMFRKSMPADRGMLFDFQHEQAVMMWMRNTYIPLDMIYIARTGRVVGIIANAKPLSDQILSVLTPTFAVLELNGGTAAKIGLKVGDMVHDPIFGP